MWGLFHGLCLTEFSIFSDHETTLLGHKSHSSPMTLCESGVGYHRGTLEVRPIHIPHGEPSVWHPPTLYPTLLGESSFPWVPDQYCVQKFLLAYGPRSICLTRLQTKPWKPDSLGRKKKPLQLRASHQLREMDTQSAPGSQRGPLLPPHVYVKHLSNKASRWSHTPSYLPRVTSRNVP